MLWYFTYIPWRGTFDPYLKCGKYISYSTVVLYGEYARGVVLPMHKSIGNYYTSNYKWKIARLRATALLCFSVFLYSCRISVYCGLILVFLTAIHYL